MAVEVDGTSYELRPTASSFSISQSVPGYSLDILPVESSFAAEPHWFGNNDFDLSIDLSNSDPVDLLHRYYEDDDSEKYQEPLGPSIYCTDPLYPMIVSSDKDIDLSNNYNGRERADYALHPSGPVQPQSYSSNMNLYNSSVIELTRDPEDGGEEIAQVE